MNRISGSYKSNSFRQYRRSFYTSANGLACEQVNCLCFATDGKVLAGTDDGLYCLENGTAKRILEKGISGRVTCFYKDANGIKLGCGTKVFELKGRKAVLVRDFDDAVLKIDCDGSRMWVLTENRIFCTDDSLKNTVITRGLEGGTGRCLSAANGEVYISTQGYISTIHGKRMEWRNIIPCFSTMPAGEISALAFDGSGYLWVGSLNGASVYDGGNRWFTSETIHTLPKNQVFDFFFDGEGGIYYATDAGVYYQKDGGMKCFSACRWLPSNKINAVIASEDGSVIYAATDKGVSEITRFETTLEEKAEKFEELMEKLHIRRGFTASSSAPGFIMENGEPDISDNDGLWTACYVAAESFRYAATGSDEALKKARRGLEAMLLLTKISGVPGFTARAVRYPGDCGYGDGDREWHLAPDGETEWKGETSSDEMTGHFFGMSVYYDLCANKSEKAKIKKALCGILDHIVANNYRLVDCDGLPTTWAVWDPEFLNRDDKWFCERGINSLELLAFTKVCCHISGEEKYEKLYKKLISVYHYPLNAMQHKIRDAHSCHIDDNLGFLASFTLLRLEDNPALRAVLLCGVEDHWQYEKVEKQPLFSMVHAYLTGRDSDIADGVQSLREMPYDMVHYFMDNTVRKDIVIDDEQEAWFEDPQLKYPVPYDEMNLYRPDAGVFRLKSGGKECCEDPTIYLLPYWLGRWAGLIG